MVELFYGGAYLDDQLDNYSDDPSWYVTTSASQIIQNVFKYNEPTSTKNQDRVAKKPPPNPKEEEKKIVLRVPMCCTECEETIIIMLERLSGVKGVECDIYEKKVTVKVNAGAVPADILRTCKKLFKKSALWE